jgi:xanthine/CO dehydrogenase XdhC/CoxF family maturation factor
VIERAVIAAATALRAAGEPFVVATVVRVSGSAYRRPGARLILARDRRVAGSVSGGCLERDLVRTAWWRATADAPALVRYDARLPDDADDIDIRAAFGIGCDGVVDVLVERAPAAGAVDPIEFAADCARGERRGAIATVFASRDPRVAVGARMHTTSGGELAGTGLPAELAAVLARELDAAIACGASASRTFGGVDVLVEAVVPPPALFVFGDGHDAVPVIELGRAIGWPVVACVARPAPAGIDRADRESGGPVAACARLDRCARAFAVVMNHDYALDRRCLAALLASQARYIGVLGPRARTARLLRDLGDVHDPRIHAPVGLDLGGETPAEVALSIVAEIQAVAADAAAVPLRDRRGAIHAIARAAESAA